MSKFYEETMQSLLQAVEISKGNVQMSQVKGMPAKTYRVCTDGTHNGITMDSTTSEEQLTEITA